jgi:uncharacterized protein YegL
MYKFDENGAQMSSSDQIPFSATSFSAAEFAENPEQRCACLLLLDTSSSMKGDPIHELNAGLVAFKDELAADSLALKRVEVAVVGFGPVKVHQPFTTAADFYPPELQASGDTPMGSAIELGIDLLQQRKEEYKANGISYYRPWIFLITDGAPTDEWDIAINLIREGEEAKRFMFFAVGVEGANMEVLDRLSVREPLRLAGLRFRELFQWLSSSLSQVSASTPGDAVPLPNPYARPESPPSNTARLENPFAPKGWAVAE